MRYIFLALHFLCCLPVLTAQEPQLTVNHGPYLQELAVDGVTVLWTTNSPCVGRVEYGIGEQFQVAQTVRHGLINANTTHHAVRITGLKPGQKYQYRLVNTEITKFGAYDTTLGKTNKSDAYSFTTLNPAPAEFTFVVTQDIHSQAEKYSSLLDKVDVKDADFVVLNGDIDNDPKEESQIYSGHLDISVERFAKEKPFLLVTGNHETRAAFARKLFDLYPHSSGRQYYSFVHGGVYFMVLASGEDKPDDHPVYAGLNAFDEYRSEQAAWIKQELQTSAARLARYRVVFTHIPAYIASSEVAGRSNQGYTVGKLSEIWAPLFRSGNVDLVISGHTHRHSWVAPGSDKGDYALLIGSNQEIETIKVTEKAIEINVHGLTADGNKYLVPRRVQ
ncbi:MAG: metallophosphoesterase family protein [Holophagaceae bacterium]|nr:metallophosphoesterase family protein [Holophagaceae bacterium]